MDCKVGDPRVGSHPSAHEGAPKVRLLRRYIQRDCLQRGIKESNALAVQPRDGKKLTELQGIPESSLACAVLSGGKDMCNKTVNGQNGDRCPTRKRRIDRSCIYQKVSDKLENRRRNRELTETIPPPQATVENNKSDATDAGAKVCSPAEEELRSIQGNYSKRSKRLKTCGKSPDAESAAENTGNQTEFLEIRPAELIGVLEKQLQHCEAANRVHLEAEGRVGNTQRPKGPETCSAAVFQSGTLKLSQNSKHLIDVGIGQNTAACGKETHSPGAMEKHGTDASVVLTDTALEPAGGLQTIKVFAPGKLGGFSNNCGREVNEAQSQASGVSLGCARTTPFLETCARTNPFERKRFRTRYHRALEQWFERAREISTAGATSEKQVFETMNSCLLPDWSYFTEEQEYLQSVEAACFLLSELSLDEEKYHNKGDLKNNLPSEINPASLTFASEQMTQIQPIVSSCKAAVVNEFDNQLKDTGNAVKIIVPQEVANVICEAENHSRTIKESKLNGFKSDVDGTLMFPKLSEFEISFLEDSLILGNDTPNTQCNRARKALVLSTAHKSLQEKCIPVKERSKAGKVVQSPCIPAIQNGSSPFKCGQLNAQFNVEVIDQITAHTYFGDYSSLDLETTNNVVNANALPMLASPGDYNLEPSFDTVQNTDTESTLSENYPKPPHSNELFNSIKKTKSNETKEICNKNFERKLIAMKSPHIISIDEKSSLVKLPNIVRMCELNVLVKVPNIVRAYEENNPVKVPDIVRAYEEDALVLDVIQDDPELFGSPSKNNDASQTSQQSTGQKGAGGRKLESTNCVDDNLGISEINNEDCKDRLSSTCVHLSELGSSEEVLNCTTHPYEFKPESNIPLGAKNYYEIDIYMEKSVEDGDATGSGDHPSQDISISKTDELLHSSENGICVRGRCSDKSILRADLSMEPPLSVSPLPTSAIPNDFRFTSIHSVPSTSVRSPPSPQLNSQEQRSATKPVASSRYLLELAALPSGYCRYYFATVKGCKRNPCRFGHEPKKEHEKLCIEIIPKFMESNNPQLLSRAARIVRKYYRNFGPGIHCNSHVMNQLLFALLKVGKLRDLFELLSTVVMMNMLPEAELLLNVFELVASTGSSNLLPKLIDITCKCVEVGLSFQPDQFKNIVQLLTQLQVSQQEINVILTLENRSLLHPAEQNNFDFAIAEIEHYKEKGEWDKIGILYQSLHLNCGDRHDLHRVAMCIAGALIQAKDDGPVVPFCEFAKAVLQKPHTNGLTKHLLGRIGMSVMVAYYGIEKWEKTRQTLDTLQEIQPNFTEVKALVPECSVSMCQLVNIAADVFLKTRCVNQALQILQEFGWTIDAPAWPYEEVDILNRQKLLFSLADAAMTKNMYCQTLDILQHSSGFQNVNGVMDVAQYGRVFNKLLDECIQNHCLGVSLDTVDFMRSTNIPINSLAVRNLITALGRCCLWLKARKQYKQALTTGCYPPMEVNLLRRLLPVPYFMSEVEMLLAIEVFLVTNASSVQSPSVSKQPFQIVLRRPEDERSNFSRVSNEEYEAAVNRLMAAARISEPKLQVKHTTVSIAREEVFSLEYASALKWLEQNMYWAGKAWLSG